jgi:hypothetical protein
MNGVKKPGFYSIMVVCGPFQPGLIPIFKTNWEFFQTSLYCPCDSMGLKNKIFFSLKSSRLRLIQAQNLWASSRPMPSQNDPRQNKITFCGPSIVFNMNRVKKPGFYSIMVVCGPFQPGLISIFKTNWEFFQTSLYCPCDSKGLKNKIFFSLKSSRLRLIQAQNLWASTRPMPSQNDP